MEQRTRRFLLGNAAGALVFSCMMATASAAEQCKTVKECAEGMVTLANTLQKENQQLLARIQALELALAKQKVETAAALEKRISELKTGNDQEFFGGNGKTSTCPPGSYMVGARFQSDGGGPHGIISSFGPTCRTMP